MRAQPRRGKGFVDVRAAFVAQREAAEAMQPRAQRPLHLDQAQTITRLYRLPGLPGIDLGSLGTPFHPAPRDETIHMSLDCYRERHSFVL